MKAVINNSENSFLEELISAIRSRQSDRKKAFKQIRVIERRLSIVNEVKIAD